jgi:WD40 repeat protein
MRKTTLMILLFLACIVPAVVVAREPSSEPVLRLNLDMHFAMVRRISSDTKGRFVLTCSEDKTARLWDASGGSLLKIFRVPAEKGNEGKLFACALSPDGTIAAVGGWTSYNYQGNFSIILFDTSTGEIVQRLSGLENVICDLEFHTDGTLAASLVRDNGIRFFRKSDGRYVMYHKDTDYGSSSCSLAFDNTGRLASASYDGYVRLYDSHFKLIKKVKPTGGKRPSSVTFSADGSKLAVGYDDSGTVEVLNRETLELLYRPDNTGAENQSENLASLTFSSDGYLYGGGFYKKYIDGAWWNLVRRWDNEGRGAFIDFKAAYDSIMDIKHLSDGSILVAAGQPDFGRYTTAGERIFYKRGQITEFANNDRFEHFTVNGDGSQISFKPLGLKPFTFDINNRELKQSAALFQKYTDSNGSIRVTKWENEYSPEINGKKASFLKEYEICRSVDIADDGTILIGADWGVYALDSESQKKWRADVPGTAWAVNVSEDGKTAVAIHGGGEIRWYRMTDGAVLLSLFMHPDGKRWVMWSPEGYYDASVGADTLVGWHINNGADQAADFFPLSRFASKYYRPDVIARVLKAGDTKKALAAANLASKKKIVNRDIKQMLPPVLAIVSPQNGAKISSNQVVVRYKLRNPSGQKVTGFKVLVDGRPVNSRGLRVEKAEDISEITVPVPSKDSTISIIAENRFSASEPATVRLSWKGEEAFIIKPKLYVLAIGVSQYKDKTLTLEYAAKDARDFSHALSKQKGGLYRDVQTRILADDTATKGDILDGLDWVLHETTQKDIAMIFLAGHGVNDDYGKYYYLPQNTNIKKLRRTAVPYTDIKETVSNIAGKALFFIDTCHSGNILGKRRGASDTTGIINALISAENGVVVFASSTGRQYSLEDSVWGNGAFTKALVEGISGKAAYRGNKITVNMLDLYISERVKELTGGRQTPTTAKPSTVPDFPVALRN